MSGRLVRPQSTEPENALHLGLWRQLPAELGGHPRRHESRNHRREPDAIHTSTVGRRRVQRNRVFPYTASGRSTGFMALKCHDGV